MTHTARLAREDAITEALRAADAAIGAEQPTSQAMRIIDAIKRLRADGVRVNSTERVDYLGHVQQAAKTAWINTHDPTNKPGPEGADASAGVDTPLGRLVCTTWRKRWQGGRGERVAWASEYTLADKAITVAEIRAAGLAQRPTTRRRQSKQPITVGTIDHRPSELWKNR